MSSPTYIDPANVHQCSCETCQRDPEGETAELHAQMNLFAGTLDEKQRRLFAGLEANRRGYGGQTRVATILGISEPTVRRGQRELETGEILAEGVRRPGAGRKPE